MVGLSQSCTTRHLQALERRRVVVGARDGKRVMYRLRHEEPGLDPLLAWALRARPAGRGLPRTARKVDSGPRPLGARPHLADLAAASVAAGPAAEPAGSEATPPDRPSAGSLPDQEAHQAEPAPALPRARTNQDLEDYLL